MPYSRRKSRAEEVGDDVLRESGASASSGAAESAIEVGEALKEKQSEWLELLMHEEILATVIPSNRMQQEALRGDLAAMYFLDAVRGRPVEYPQCSSELICYKISRSSRFLLFFSLVTLLNLVLPFFTQPYCAHSSYRENDQKVDLYDSSNPHNFISRSTVWTISVCCLLVYYFEVVIRFYAGFSVRKSFFADRWLVFRAVACVALTVDYWSYGGVYTFSNACIPFIYISRRHSLRKIVEGVIFAASKCVDVFVLVLFLLLLWSFVGFLIFSNLDTPDDLYSKFDSLPESFYMCMQTFATRSFLPFVLKPYYEINPASTLFFVSLVIVTDLLCTALIIATGNRQYRVHANNVFDEQLQCRKQAVIAAFQLLCDPPEAPRGDEDVPNEDIEIDVEYLKLCSISREKWLLFCKSLPSTRVTLSEEKMHMIFNLERHKALDSVDLAGYFKLCAVLDAKFHVGVKPKEPKIRYDDSDRGLSTASEGEMSFDEQSLSGTKKRSSLLDSVSRRLGLSSDQALMEDSPSDSASQPQSSPETSRKRKSHIKRKGERRSSVIMAQQRKEQLMRGQVKSRESSHSDESPSKEALSQSDASSGGAVKDPKRHYKEVFWRWVKIIQGYLRYWLNYSVVINIVHFEEVTINIFDAIVILMRLLLVVTLIMVSNVHVAYEWLFFWWFLEAYFWCEMIFLLLACGWKEYIKEHGLGVPLVVNVVSLMLMSFTHRDEHRSGYLYVLTMITQSIRLPSLIMQYQAAAVFISIFPLVIRVIFLIFALIYAFSSLTFNRFCDVLDANLVNAEVEEGVDDFIEPWVSYSQQLNFRTFGGSLFTLFEISILGNWSAIMNSARLKEPILSLLFFFTYRIIMQLCIYPILNSFIIAAYIARKDIQSKEEEAKRKEAAMRARRDLFFSDVLTSASNSTGDIELGSMESRPRADTDLIGNKLGAFKRFSTKQINSWCAEINIRNTKADSMISFWSGTGTERYIPRKKTPDAAQSNATHANETMELRSEVDFLRAQAEKHLEYQRSAEFRIESLERRLREHEHQA